MDPREFDAYLADLEVRLERLRSLYEQYFLGIERIEPAVAKKDVERRFWAIRKVRVNNTARKFRLQTVIQRYNTLQQYWNRICRQIENGTYVRHVARAKRRFGTPSEPPRISTPSESLPPPSSSKRSAALKQTEMDLGAMLMDEINADEEMRLAVEAAFDAISADDRKSKQPRTQVAEPIQAAAKQPKQAAAKRPAPRTQSSARKSADQNATAQTRRSKKRSGTLSDDRIDGLYKELVTTRQGLKQAGAVDRGALAKSLRATEAKLRKTYAGRDVDFRVDVKDGKASIKPIVR